MQSISLADLDRNLASSEPGWLLDVRLEEDFSAGHLPNARSACVFKASFIDDIAKLGASPSQPLIVYGASAASHESRVAAEKLERAGYQRVTEFRPGVHGWKEAGRKLEGGGEVPAPEVLDGTYSIDLAESRVEWTGRNLLNKHTGTVPIKSGHVTFQKGWMAGGDFVIDLTAIQCGTLADPATNQQLVAHLQSDDFFDVAKHPVARFQIRKVEPVPGGGVGSPNLRVSGELTLRGRMHPLVLLAVAGRTPDGRAAAQAVFAFDRTVWGAIYGSGKFFQRLGMHLVNDLVEIQVRLLI